VQHVRAQERAVEIDGKHRQSARRPSSLPSVSILQGGCHACSARVSFFSLVFRNTMLPCHRGLASLFS
jgi:hypothetical protein